jgi:hypothetical protein
VLKIACFNAKGTDAASKRGGCVCACACVFVLLFYLTNTFEVNTPNLFFEISTSNTKINSSITDWFLNHYLSFFCFYLFVYYFTSPTHFELNTPNLFFEFFNKVTRKSTGISFELIGLYSQVPLEIKTPVGS